MPSYKCIPTFKAWYIGSQLLGNQIYNVHDICDSN